MYYWKLYLNNTDYIIWEKNILKNIRWILKYFFKQY